MRRRRRVEYKATTHEERILEVWSHAEGTTGDAVRWALAEIVRLERENRRLNAELMAAARELAAERVRSMRAETGPRRS